MNKLRRLLPLLLLVLALAFYLYPSQDSTAATAGESVVSTASDMLSLPASAPDEAASAQPDSSVPQPDESEPVAEAASVGQEDALLPEDGSYTTKEDVSLYLIQYGHLPSNFITKKEAQNAGWSGGSLDKVLPGMCIGGDRFGNYEGLLPKAKGRTWTECDINTLGKKSRGAERLVFSNDGLIFYSDDHYDSFTQLY